MNCNLSFLRSICYKALFSGVAFGLTTLVAVAGDVDVEAVSFEQENDGSYRFDVTLRHADTGWEHYADRWEVLTTSGEILATRVLYHPHESEQPFTRSLSDVKIPDGVRQVVIRGHDSVHGYSGKEKKVELN